MALYNRFGRTKPSGPQLLNYGHSLTVGLTGCWIFNEGGGKVAHDLTGIHPATATTGAWTNDGNGPAANINGTAANVFATAANIATAATPLTAACWCQSYSPGVSANMIPFNLPNVALYPDGTETMETYYHGTQAHGSTAIDGAPHFYVMTVSPTGLVSLFTDGVLVGTASGSLASQAAGALSFGGNGSSDLWNGSISQAMFYTGRGLLAADVAELWDDRYQFLAIAVQRQWWNFAAVVSGGNTFSPFRSRILSSSIIQVSNIIEGVGEVVTQ